MGSEARRERNQDQWLWHMGHMAKKKKRGTRMVAMKNVSNFQIIVRMRKYQVKWAKSRGMKNLVTAISKNDGAVRRGCQGENTFLISIEPVKSLWLPRWVFWSKYQCCDALKARWYLWCLFLLDVLKPVGMFKEASDRSIRKSSLIEASVVSWQIMTSVKLRSIWSRSQLCLIEASAEKWY